MGLLLVILIGIIALGVMVWLFGQTLFGGMLIFLGIRSLRTSVVERDRLKAEALQVTPAGARARESRLRAARERSPWLPRQAAPQLTTEQIARAAIVAAAKTRNPWIP
jgi:predicted lipid-binding transport protein (Tim44 family)